MKKIINPWLHKEGYNCFGCAPGNPAGLKMTFYEDGDEITAVWKPDARFQGWLNTLHGGIQATLLDEAAGWVIFRKMQTGGVTSKMETRFLKPIRTDEEHVTIRARISSVKRNLVTVEATLSNAADEICTHASILYFTFSRDYAEKEMFFKGCHTEEEE